VPQTPLPAWRAARHQGRLHAPCSRRVERAEVLYHAAKNTLRQCKHAVLPGAAGLNNYAHLASQPSARPARRAGWGGRSAPQTRLLSWRQHRVHQACCQHGCRCHCDRPDRCCRQQRARQGGSERGRRGSGTIACSATRQSEQHPTGSSLGQPRIDTHLFISRWPRLHRAHAPLCACL
jgi:hypothetical protein